MSKAVICDMCKKAFPEPASTVVEAKYMFITTHFDFCPQCREKFKEMIYKKERSDNAEK